MKNMTKKEVSQRVLQNGEPLALNKFFWDKKMRAFFSRENNLIIDFADINYCTVICNDYCTVKSSSHCTVKSGNSCKFITTDYCSFTCNDYCSFKSGSYCTFNSGVNCKFETNDFCTFTTAYCCLFKTGGCCTFKTEHHCFFKTTFNCTFDIYEYGYIYNTDKNNISVLSSSDGKKNYDLDTLAKDKLIKLSMDSDPIYKSIPQDIQHIDDDIYILTTPTQIHDYEVCSATEIDDYLNDRDIHCKIAKKVVNNVTYYAQSKTIKKAFEDVNFKILSETFKREDIAKSIKAKNNYINWSDYLLLTGASEQGITSWLEKNGLTTDTIFNIHNFYKEYKDKNVYGFNKFKEFYIEWF